MYSKTIAEIAQVFDAEITWKKTWKIVSLLFESTEDEADDNDDIDVDEYTPAKDYKRKTLETDQPKRKRGRPRKIRDPNEPPKNYRKGKIFKCPHCVKSFTRRHRVAIHIRLRHGFECVTCNLK